MHPPAAPSLPRLPLQASDLRGLARLGVDGVLGITDLVEAMHHTIASRTAIGGPPPSGRTQGITGFVYRAVRGTTRGVGWIGDALLGALPSRAAAPDTLRHPPREALLAALNGVWGDHLADSRNPLAIAMTLRPGHRDAAPATIDDEAQVSSRVLVLVHGLCMNDLQWRRHGHDHGTALAQALGCTPLYLHYNSGRHISSNGRDFARLLDHALAQWPVPVQDLAIVGHSMGGLVARSACHHAQQQRLPWLAHLKSLVFLGTPHHGAPLERGGHLLDTVFGLSPYVAPFTRLGGSRSAGITDLRYGNLQDADGQDRLNSPQRRDGRRPTPLPPGVRVSVVAATLSAEPCSRRSRLLGDGLVPLASALGEHADPRLALALPPSQQLVVPKASHWDLLDREEVTARLVRWLDG